MHIMTNWTNELRKLNPNSYYSEWELITIAPIDPPTDRHPQDWYIYFWYNYETKIMYTESEDKWIQYHPSDIPIAADNTNDRDSEFNPYTIIKLLKPILDIIGV